MNRLVRELGFLGLIQRESRIVRVEPVREGLRMSILKGRRHSSEAKNVGRSLGTLLLSGLLGGLFALGGVANATVVVKSIVVISSLSASNTSTIPVLVQGSSKGLPFTPVTISGGEGPVVFTVSPALPTGLTLDKNTGAISGIPSGPVAATTFTVTATDAKGTAVSRSFGLTVSAGLSGGGGSGSGPTPSPAAEVGVPLTVTPLTVSGGTAPIAYSVVPALPTGLTLNPNTGVISGTPSEAVRPAKTYTLTGTDANGSSTSQKFDLTIPPGLSAQVNTATYSTVQGISLTGTTYQPVTGLNGAGGNSYSVSPALPSGLTLNSDGSITGTPSAVVATTMYTITVRNSLGVSATGVVSLAVTPSLSGTNTSVIPVLVQGSSAGLPFTPVTINGGKAPVVFTVSPALPTGLTLNKDTGAISGTPTAGQATTTYTVTATDANGTSASRAFSLTVNGVLSTTQAVSTKNLTQGSASGLPFTPVTVSGGGTPAYALKNADGSAAASLPAGLSFNPSTGEISGTPTASLATTTYTVQVTDNAGGSSSKTFSLTVSAGLSGGGGGGSGPTPSPAAEVGVPLTVTPLTVSGGTAPIAYSVVPALPTGLTLNPNTGVISGTPSEAVRPAKTYTLTGTDANGSSTSQKFDLTIPPGLSAQVNTATYSTVQGISLTGTTYQPVTGLNGAGGNSYSVSPALPSGLTLNSDGSITGTPSAVVAATMYTITVRNSLGVSATGAVSLAVIPSLSGTNTSVIPVLVQGSSAGLPFTPVTINGGKAPVVFTVSPALPTGLTLNKDTGAISGTPTVGQATTTYTVTATDANGTSANRAFSLTVNGVLSTTQAVSAKNLTQGSASGLPFTPVTVSGGVAPYTYALKNADGSAAATLPAGLIFSAGVISGTPTVSLATTTYTVQVTDNAGSSSSKTFSLTVSGPIVATVNLATAYWTVGAPSLSRTPVTFSGGNGTLRYAISPPVEPGMSFSTATGALSGTPTADNSSGVNYTVTATDQNGATASGVFRYDEYPAVTTRVAVASKTVAQGSAITGFIPVVFDGGGFAPYTYALKNADGTAAASLPAGLSFNTGTGEITGTPTASLATTTYTVQVSDVNGGASSKTFSLTVGSSFSTTQAVGTKNLTQGSASGLPFTPVTVSGGVAPYTYALKNADGSAAATLPAGLIFSAGVISGTPTVSLATTTYTVQVTDNAGSSSSKTFSLTVSGPIVATVNLATAYWTVGAPSLSRTPVTFSGGNGTLRYAISPPVEPGMSFSTATGALSGTPTADNSSGVNYTVTATDQNGATASGVFRYDEYPAVTTRVAVASKTVAQGSAITGFIPVVFDGGGFAPYTYALKNADGTAAASLPAGLSFNTGTGEITGTPTASLATTTYTVQVSDVNGGASSKTFSLTVSSAPLVATVNVANWYRIIGTSQTTTPITFTGGSPPYAYSISPSLPAGLSLAPTTGVISGAPSGASSGTTYTMTVTDQSGATKSGAFTYFAAPALAANVIQSGIVFSANGTLQTVTPMQGSGGFPPYQYSMEPSPIGLSIDPNTGTISGQPFTPSEQFFTVRVTDQTGGSAALSLTYSAR